MKGNVWVAPGGIVGANVIGENIRNSWVQTKRNSIRIFGSPVAPHPV